MKQYRVLFGGYVRMYADHTIHAENNDAARQLAIEQFKAGNQEMEWCDPQYDNVALPSIVTMQIDDPPGDILEGTTFRSRPPTRASVPPTQCSKRFNSCA